MQQRNIVVLQKQLELLIEVLPVGVLLCAYEPPATFTVVKGNRIAAKFLKKQTARIRNKNLTALFPAVSILPRLADVMKSGKSFSTEHIFYKHEGIETSLTIEAQRIDQQTLVLFLHNTTNEKKLQEALEEQKNEVHLLTEKLRETLEERKVIETALRSSEELFTKAFRTSPDSVNINRLRDGLYVAINEGFTALTGYTEDDVRGKTSLELNIWVNPADRERLVEELQRTGKVKELEAQFRLKDGRIRTGVMSASVVHINNEPCIISITRDITEKRELEEKKRLQELQYETLFESSPDAIVVVDSSFRILSVNRRTVELWGATSKEYFLGRNVLEFIAPKEHEEAVRKNKELRETGNPHTTIYHFQKADGSPLVCEVNVALFPKEKEKEDRFVAILRDVTEKLRIEAERSTLAYALKSIHDSVVILDENGIIRFVNEQFEKTYGYSADELKGQPYKQILFEGIVDELDVAFESCRKEGEWKGEQIHRKKNGAYFPMLSYLYPIHDEHQDIRSYVNILQDLTHRRRTEEILRMIVRGTSQTVGIEFFNSLVYQVASALMVKAALVGSFAEDVPEQFSVLATWNNNRFWDFEEHKTLTLKKEERELFDGEKSDFYFPDELSPTLSRVFFPQEDMAIAGMIILKNEQKKCIGAIVLGDTKVRELERQEIAVLKIFAARTTAELQRLKAESEWRKLLLAVEYNPIAIAIIDKDHRVEYINPQFTALTGYSLKDVQYQPLHSLVFEHSTVLQELLSRSRNTLLSNDDVYITRKDRGTFLSYLRVIPIVDMAKNPTHYILLIEDVSYQKRIEEKLRSAEQRYREIFENDITGDYVCAADGSILECNAAFISMFDFKTRAEALHTNIKELMVPSDFFDELLNRLRVQKRLVNEEMEMRRVNGKVIYVVQNLHGIYDENGALREIRGYIFNDTDRRQLEMQMRQTQKMEIVGTLAGGIAHDFNNILNNIIGFSTQIKKHIQEPEKIQRYCDTIEKSASQGAQIASQLLQFSRLKDTESDYVDVESILQEVLTLVHETFPKNITVVDEISESLYGVQGDRGALYEVFLNLCVNARDAMPAGGILTVRAENLPVGDEVDPRWFSVSTETCIRVQVSDTGIGIDESYLPKIFDPFFTTKEKGKGTGLGLSIAYNAVKNHGGSIFVESTVGKGTRFSVYLPAIINTGNKEEYFPSFQPERGNQELILLVDDEEPMLLLGQEILEEQGYRVLTAKNGQEAIDIYKERWREIDLVILDLIMPLKDGGETYLEMKEINPALKAFFCSGFTSDKVITQLLEQENLRAVQKPFRNEDLLATVHTVLHQSRP